MALVGKATFFVVCCATLYMLLSSPYSSANLELSLKGHVAVVTGGSRGIGKGIAFGLAEVGATVYVTGRTVKGANNTGGPKGQKAGGSAQETCELIQGRGGKCIAVAVNSADDAALQGFFDQIMRDEGRLDVLVNNAFSGVSWLPQHSGKPFWEKPIQGWDEVNGVGLRSHYIASVFAAQIMTKAKRGLIVNVGSFGGNNYIFDVIYGIGKAGMDRMANDMAVELATHNVAMVSLWPGLVKTENVESQDNDGFSKLTSHRGLQPGSPEFDLKEWLPTALAETPLYSGRVVAALARDKNIMQHSGKVVVNGVAAGGYGVVDERGVRTPSFISVKFVASILLSPVLKTLGLWEAQGTLFQETPPHVSDVASFYWNTLPDFNIPGKLVKLGAGAPNL